MREIVFDTETTGLDPASGHRVVEIGCVELYNGIPTGRTLHHYLDPQRDMPAEAFAVHGLSSAFLAGKPLFKDVAEEFLAFTAGAKLVAHNAEFDFRFMTAELVALGHPALELERMVDTLALARRRHPGRAGRPRRAVPALRHRQFAPHQARRAARCRDPGRGLRRAQWRGARPPLVFAGPATRGWGGVSAVVRRPRPVPLAPALTPDEAARHAAFVAGLGDAAIWRHYAALEVAAGAA